MGLGYDSWLEKPYQDQCDWEDRVDREIDRYRSEPDFIKDARAWAIKKGLNPDEIESLEDDYWESEECYEFCAKQVEKWEGSEY